MWCKPQILKGEKFHLYLPGKAGRAPVKIGARGSYEQRGKGQVWLIELEMYLMRFPGFYR